MGVREEFRQQLSSAIVPHDVADTLNSLLGGDGAPLSTIVSIFRRVVYVAPTVGLHVRTMCTVVKNVYGQCNGLA